MNELITLFLNRIIFMSNTRRLFLSDAEKNYRIVCTIEKNDCLKAESRENSRSLFRVIIDNTHDIDGKSNEIHFLSNKINLNLNNWPKLTHEIDFVLRYELSVVAIKLVANKC